MRICLFDWNVGGHHNYYTRATADALAPRAEVVMAASDPVLAGFSNPEVKLHSLGDPRPRPGPEPGLDKATLARRELALMREAIAATEADHLFNLLIDPVLRWMVREPPFDAKISGIVFFATAHLPRAYGLPLTPRERASALFKEWNIRRWRRRPDAHAVFSLDPEAARLWSGKRGAQARWIPEPPLEVTPTPRPASERRGCVLFGYLDERKGIDRLADALSRGCEGLELTMIGEVAPEYRPELERHLARMEAGGVVLDTRLERIPYAETMTAMAASRCALLSFGWKPTMSRVMLEASGARTPVVASGEGPVAKMVERHGLGVAADPTDPVALREAILSLAADEGAQPRYEENLRAYVEDVVGLRSVSTLREAFELEP